MVFVRNWVDGVGPSPITQKVLSVVIGAGGVFRPPARLGVQIFGAQYAVVLGDLKTAGGDIQDIMGNLWSVGIALVMGTQALRVDEFTCARRSRESGSYFSIGTSTFTDSVNLVLTVVPAGSSTSLPLVASTAPAPPTPAPIAAPDPPPAMPPITAPAPAPTAPFFTSLFVLAAASRVTRAV
jgi:hypothetical protein